MRQNIHLPGEFRRNPEAEFGFKATGKLWENSLDLPHLPGVESPERTRKPSLGGIIVKGLRVSAACVLVLLVAAGMFPARGEEKTTTEEQPGKATGGRVENVWGRVADTSAKKMLLGIKVETEKGEEIQIFKLTKETTVRKEEKVKTLNDLRKGILVIVFFRAKEEDEKYPTALFIRIPEDRIRRPGRRLLRRPR